MTKVKFVEFTVKKAKIHLAEASKSTNQVTTVVAGSLLACLLVVVVVVIGKSSNGGSEEICVPVLRWLIWSVCAELHFCALYLLLTNLAANH